MLRCRSGDGVSRGLVDFHSTDIRLHRNRDAAIAPMGAREGHFHHHATPDVEARRARRPSRIHRRLSELGTNNGCGIVDRASAAPACLKKRQIHFPLVWVTTHPALGNPSLVFTGCAVKTVALHSDCY
jgi:hypothetical protein